MNKPEVGVFLDVANGDDLRRQTIRDIRDFRRERERSVIVSVPNFYLLQKRILRSPDEAL
jgi:hypothetical protein